MLTEVLDVYRSRVLYRKARYMKRRNLRTINFCVRLLLAALVVVPVFCVICSRITPSLQMEAERAVYARMEAVVAEAVREVLSDSTIADRITEIRKDDAGNVDIVEIDTAEMNKLIAELSSCLALKLQQPESFDIGIPLGNVAGFGFACGQGPLVKTHILSGGKADVSYSFNTTDSSGEGRMIKNLVTLHIYISASFKGPFISGGTELASSIPIAEQAIRN